MIKKLILISTLLLAISGVNAQQDALLSFLNFADAYNNPAHMVNSRFWTASLDYKNSLAGFNDAPQSYYFSFGGPLGMKEYTSSFRSSQVRRDKDPQYAIGGYILQNSHGFYSYGSYMINYAQKFKFSRNQALSFGLGLGIYSYSIDPDKLRVENENDPSYADHLQAANRLTMGDVNFSTLFATEKYQVGIAVRHLLGDMLKLGDTPDYAKLEESVNFFAKTRLDVYPGIECIPHVMSTYTKGVPLDVKLSAPFVIEEKFLAGLGYSYGKEISIEAGVYYKNVLFGYSFSIHTSKISSFARTAHEIGISYVVPLWSPYHKKATMNKILF